MSYKLPSIQRSRRGFLAIVFVILASITVALSHDAVQKQNSFTITVNPSLNSKNHEAMPMNMGEGMTHYDAAIWAEEEFVVPEDMWITEFSSEGSGMAPHSFSVFIKDTEDSWCPENPVTIWAGGTVTAQKPTEFSVPYGVFLKKGTTLLLEVMFHSMAGEQDGRQPTVFSVRAAYEPSGASMRTRKIFFYIITPAPCSTLRPIFPIPPHSVNATFSTRNKPFVFPEDGSIIRAGAHFHGSYEKGILNTVRLFLNNIELDSFATTNVGNGDERNPQLLKKSAPVTVHAGDKLWMEAIFNNPGDSTVPEGMAIIGFHFAPEK